MRRFVPLLLALAAAATPAAAQSGPSGPSAPVAGCGASFPTYDPPAVATGRLELEAEIPMSDGVVLRARVTLPTGVDGPHPTALTTTGYNRRAGIGASGGGLVDHGYATVLVDDRGTGTSDGDWDSWGQRMQADYAEVLDWIVAQPWSDGRVGVTGGSYMGITSLFTAAHGHPAVKAVFAVVPMADAYRDIVFAGGQVNTAFIPLWMGLVTATGAPQHLAGAADFQVPMVADAALGGESAYDGPFWRQRSPIEVVPSIDVPTFVVGGLDDIFQRGEPLLYEALVANGVDARLLLGPWTHGSTGSGLPADGVPATDDLLLQWFDAHVRGLDTGADCIPPVTQYVRGDERYASAPSWPVPGLRADRWYLHGDGTLDTTAPTTTEAGRTYAQLLPTGPCTRSTNQWLIGLVEPTGCAADNRLDEAGSLTWTSEPAAAPYTINGPIQADVWVTTTGAEAVVSVAVSDVAPDGTSTGLTNGLLLSRHRAVDPARSRTLDGQSIQPWHPFTEEAVLPTSPGEPMLLPVEVFPTSATIAPGHRLRVTVAAYDVPHALPPLPAAVGTLAGVTTVLADPAHPSSVVLPIVGEAPDDRGTVRAAAASEPAGPVLARTGGPGAPLLAAVALALVLLLRRQLAP
jgi:putative CocE/NonD family hydrolase